MFCIMLLLCFTIIETSKTDKTNLNKTNLKIWFRTNKGGKCTTATICEMIAVLSLEAGQQLFMHL